MSDLLEAALAYARRGISVFPCDMVPRGKDDKGKHPLTPHGFKDATTDESKIIAWWTAHPNAGIGMATGASGFLVVDIDSYNGGDESLEKLNNGHGVITAPMIATGGGGWHYYFRRDARFGQGAGHIKGIDFRGETGYVIVPPSIHASGKAYEGTVPNPDEVPAIPEWLAAALLTEKVEAAEVDDLKIVGLTDGMLAKIPDRATEKIRTRAQDESKAEYEVACVLAELG